MTENNSSKYERRRVRGKSDNQKKYIQAITEKRIVFCVGPSGTGKSHLAVGCGIEMLLKGSIEKIVIGRPLVQADENTGYLPGDISNKLDPYLRPLYDEMSYYLHKKEISELVQTKRLEICPIAYMRGRTFKNSFVIIDEAQNCTTRQLKLILTRIGEDSKMVINGDFTQSDLPDFKMGGFKDYVNELEKINDIGVVRFGLEDVQRDPLIVQILEIIENYEKKEAQKMFSSKH